MDSLKEISLNSVTMLIVAHIIKMVLNSSIPKIVRMVQNKVRSSITRAEIERVLYVLPLIMLTFMALGGVGVVVYAGWTEPDLPATRSDVASMVLLGIWSIYLLVMLRSGLIEYRAKYLTAKPLKETATLSASLVEARYEKSKNDTV